MKDIKNIKDIYILGIESSCDETACAIVKNGKEIISNVVLSQIDIHTKFGGVVPEIASRNHVKSITIVKWFFLYMFLFSIITYLKNLNI